jgi:hypothetical protein
VVGAELAVGYVFAWLMRKGKRVGGRADEQVDTALDAGVDRAGEKLYELVAGKLQDDPALERLTGEAARGLEAPSPRLAQRVALALEDAADDDAPFSAALEELVKSLQAAESSDRRAVRAGDGGLAVGGSVLIHAEGGSFAAGVVRDVHVGNPSMPGPPKG